MIRQRSRRACEPCHRRKVRCNGKYPCDVCAGYGYDCSFPSEPIKSRKKRRTEEAALPTPAPVPAAAIAPPLPPPLLGPIPNTSDSARPAINDEAVTDKKWSYLVQVPNNKDLKLSTAPFPESLISRFTTVFSAVAFPRELGQSLQMRNAPRLHPFAWNTGTREEQLPHLGNRIFDQISLQDTLHHAKTYFEIVHPIFGMLHRPYFTRTCIAAWSLRQMPIDLEAMLCCVVALGSLFSTNTTPWPMEAAIADQSSLLLNISISSPPSQLSLKFVVAWVLRAVYLRCTTRPHLSWMATCNAMHIAEAIGLHQEFCKMELLGIKSRLVAMEEATIRRKTFWVATSLNKLFSIEYGRSVVTLESISCGPLEGDKADFTAIFVNLCQLFPRYTHGDKEDLELLLQQLAKLDVDEPPFALLKADVCFIVFRILRFLHFDLSSVQQELMLDTIRAGLAQAEVLSSIRSAWWNVISVPFHSVAILVAMNTTSSLGLLEEAVHTLKIVSSAYDTHLAREAQRTAEELVRAVRSRKIQDVDVLNRVLDTFDSEDVSTDNQHSESNLGFPLGFDWPSEDDGSWMEVFLNIQHGS